MIPPITSTLRPRVVTRKPREQTQAEQMRYLKERLKHETQRRVK